MLYRVEWSWYEDYTDVLLEGPEVEDWGAFCESLVLSDEMHQPLPKDQQEYFFHFCDEEEYCYNILGEKDIYPHLLHLLYSKGYQEVDIPTFSLWGVGEYGKDRS